MKEKFGKINYKMIVCAVIIIIFLLIVVFFKIIDKGDNQNETPKINVSKIKGIYVSNQRSYYSNSVFISGKKFKKKHCYDDICISDVEIICTESQGEINYSIINNSKKRKNVYLKIVINDFNGYIICENLEPGKKISKHIGYSGGDLRKAKSYKLVPMTATEKKAIVK